MVHGVYLLFSCTNMKRLQQTLESILDKDFDITEDDINPMREFVAKYKSNYKNNGSYFIKNNWSEDELGSIITTYYGQSVGYAKDIDSEAEIKRAYKNKETIVFIYPGNMRNLYILVPGPRQQWNLYTCDTAFTTTSLFKSYKYTSKELQDKWWYYRNAMMYILKSNKFLKDIQKCLA